MSNSVESSIFDLYDLTDQLPSLPQILLRVIAICSDPKSTFHDLNEVVKYDPALTARILHIINTPAYAMPLKVDNLERALLLTGMDVIKNIAISASVYEIFKGNERLNSRQVLEFWQHSILCAVYGLRLAKKLRYSAPDMGFLAGLMHDIGKLVLLSLSPDYLPIWKTERGQPELILALELKAGLVHTQAGVCLISHWNLDPELAAAVGSHHSAVEELKASPILNRILFAANLMASDAAKAEKLIPEILTLSVDEIRGLVRGGLDEAEQSADNLGIPFLPPDQPESAAESDPDRDELRKEVNNYALLVGSFQSFLGSATRNDLFQALEQGLSVLFHLKTFVFLEYEPDADWLVPWKMGFGKSVPETFGIPVSQNKSLAAEALVKGQVITPLKALVNQLPPASDRCLLQSMGVNGLIAVPVRYRDTPLGVVVLGVSMNRYGAVIKKEKLLKLYIQQFAIGLHAQCHSERLFRAEQNARFLANRDLSAKIVHEINNPLTIIKNYLTILGSDDADYIDTSAPDTCRMLQVIREEIDRVGGLVKKLGSFSEMADLDYIEKIAPNRVIENQVKLAGAEFVKKQNGKILYKFDPLLTELPVNPDAFRQIILNLVKNAFEAMGPQDTIEIQTRFLNEGHGSDFPVHVGLVKGFAEIRIRNTGTVIPGKMLARIFEPFTGTKNGEHQGLGLAIVHHLTDQMQGRITCTSTKEEGTVFLLLLPVLEKY